MARKPRKIVAIDTETLALTPTSAIVEIGIVSTLRGNQIEYSSGVSPGYYLGNTAGNSVANQFDVDLNTVAWHKEKNLENWDYFHTYNKNPIQLASWLWNALEDLEENKTYILDIWCCGTDFDIPILQHLLRVASMRQPWQYANVRDYRTLRELYKDTLPCPTKNSHSALEDAKNLYAHLEQILKHLKYGANVEIPYGV